MLSGLNKVAHRKKITFLAACFVLALILLLGRLVYIMIVKADHYSALADQLHERERSIKAERGRIIDRNGTVLADNKSVCTISVIHNQIEDPETVISALCSALNLSEEYVRKRVEKYTSIERIKANVDEKTGDLIEEMELAGVKVDRDYKRYYPYGELASKVIGFTGGDNQGIIGLEVVYDEYLQGKPGKILTLTDAKGIEVENTGEDMIEPIAGKDLYISLDRNIQTYAQQLASVAYEAKEATAVEILVMNPKNGEIYACVNYPEFDLNEPYTLVEPFLSEYEADEDVEKKETDYLNKMWRNPCINDTYEPGSTFKIITASAALEEGVVTTDSTFSCPGFIIVDDRRIRCHKTTGHGTQNFVEATQNSCNPVFITVGLRLGVEKYYRYFEKFGLLTKTGVDLPGEAGTIMHKMEDMGNVELATVSFGQSFQITALQLITTVSSLINGGNRVTPHFAVGTMDSESRQTQVFEYLVKEEIVSESTSATMRMILEKVVSEGSGKNGKVEGFLVGGKTATSQMLPRGSHRYISSFIGFAPADDPQVIAIAIVNEPQGIYYGSQVAAPIVRQLFENILPYLGIKEYNQ